MFRGDPEAIQSEGRSGSNSESGEIWKQFRVRGDPEAFQSEKLKDRVEVEDPLMHQSRFETQMQEAWRTANERAPWSRDAQAIFFTNERHIFAVSLSTSI